jgi:uncharacterized protein YjbJ (UPF0337 family)
MANERQIRGQWKPDQSRAGRIWQPEGGLVMGAFNKLRNKFQMGRGRVKQDVGRATGDPYLEAEGQADRVSGSAKQVGEQVKDAGRNVKDAFRR